MDAFALPLAVAAMAGASVAAVVTYSMNRETLAQLLDFARVVKGDRDRDRGTDLENARGEYDSPNLHRKKGSQRRLHRKAGCGCGGYPAGPGRDIGGGGWEASCDRRLAYKERIGGNDGGEPPYSPAIPVGLSWFHTIPGGTCDSGSDFSLG